MTEEVKEEVLVSEEDIKKFNLKPTNALKCVWNTGAPCSGQVYEAQLFDSQIGVPICALHMEDHKHIMILHKNNYDIEEVMQETAEYRKEQVLILQLSDLDNSDVKI